MKISSIIATVFLAMLATTASANEDTTEHQLSESQPQVQQDRDNEASAHGYQNPTGEDPQPRLTEDTIENAHGGDDEHKRNEGDAKQR